MTLEDVVVLIAKDRVINGDGIRLHAEQVQREISKDNIFIPEFKGPQNYDGAGPATLAADFLETEITWNMDVEFPRNPDQLFPGRNEADSSVSVSGDTITVEEQETTFINKDEYKLIGAVNINPGSVTVETQNGNTTFTEGADFKVDYATGRMQILSSGSMSTGTTYKYTLSFTYSKRTFGRLLQRMAELGGPVTIVVDDNDVDETNANVEDDEQVQSSYTVFLNDANYTIQSDRPEETTLNLSGREATDFTT